MLDSDPEASALWRRTAATMLYVNRAYRRLPAPLRATFWLLPPLVARLLDLPFPPWG